MSRVPPKKGSISLGDLFLELAKPDIHGFSRSVSVAEFTGRYAPLQLGNGGSWCRDDGPLGRKYNIVRKKPKNSIVAVELHGFKKAPISKQIPSRVRQELAQMPCVILGTGKTEIDHKDGRRDDPRPLDMLKDDDFQPLSKPANNAKRQHCKECRKTNKRFDARKLGYSTGHVRGNGKYRGSCVGCYWHDPKFFNAEVSRDWKKRS